MRQQFYIDRGKKYRILDTENIWLVGELSLVLRRGDNGDCASSMCGSGKTVVFFHYTNEDHIQ